MDSLPKSICQSEDQRQSQLYEDVYELYKQQMQSSEVYIHWILGSVPGQSIGDSAPESKVTRTSKTRISDSVPPFLHIFTTKYKALIQIRCVSLDSLFSKKRKSL